MDKKSKTTELYRQILKGINYFKQFGDLQEATRLMFVDLQQGQGALEAFVPVDSTTYIKIISKVYEIIMYKAYQNL